MTEKKKYQLLIFAVLFLGVYLLVTEVADRWAQDVRRYAELADAGKQAMSPEEIAKRKMELTTRKKALAAQLINGKGQYEQSQIGVIKLLNSSAKEENLLIRSLTPLNSKPFGQLIEQGFRIELVGTYHRLGSFINALETGPIPVRIVKMDINSQSPGSAAIIVDLEGKAFVLSKEAGK